MLKFIRLDILKVFFYLFILFTAHASCSEVTPMLAVILTYEWVCMECKTCVECSDPGQEVGLHLLVVIDCIGWHDIVTKSKN